MLHQSTVIKNAHFYTKTSFAQNENISGSAFFIAQRPKFQHLVQYS